MRYRRKPTEVEAVQFDGHAMPGVFDLIEEGTERATGYVKTMQGREVLINVGEWVVEEMGGEGHYPIADAEFQRIYERV